MTVDPAGAGDDSFDHQPVMAAEIVAAFADVPAGYVLDATLGGAPEPDAPTLAMQAGRKIADLPRDAFFRASEVLAVVIGRGAPETMAAEEAAQ